jgi:hypothetical protein
MQGPHLLIMDMNSLVFLTIPFSQVAFDGEYWICFSVGQSVSHTHTRKDVNRIYVTSYDVTDKDTLPSIECLTHGMFTPSGVHRSKKSIKAKTKSSESRLSNSAAIF